jgi:hypothetical protein
MKTWRLGGYTAAALALSIAWVAFAFPWLSGFVTIPYDAKAHFQPQIQFLANALHSGQSPFWTPNVFAGSPQVADPQSMIFSPAFLLAYFSDAPSFRAVDAYSFLLLGLAGFSVLMIFRDKGWHPVAGFFAAITAAFGGTAVWRIQYLKQVEAYAFFLLCLWLLSRALERRSLTYGVLSGLAAGLLVIEPGQIALLGCYILTAYVLVHWFRAQNRFSAIKGNILPLLGGGVAATLIASVPILLTYLFVSASSRPAFEFAEAARGALHPASLLTFVIGDLYGAADKSIDYWGPGAWNWNAHYLSMSENMGQMYFGALPALLLLIGIFRRVLFAREVRLYTITGAVLLIFCLSWYTPLFKLMFDYVPGIQMFRRPSDASYQLGAMVAIVTGYVLHRFLTDLPQARLPREVPWGVAVLAALFATAVAIAVWRGYLKEAIEPMIVAVVALSIAAATLYALRRRSWGSVAYALPLVAIVSVIDLAYHNGMNPSTAEDPEVLAFLKPTTTNETIRFLKANVRTGQGSVWRDRVEMTGLGVEWPNVSLVHGLDHTLGYNPLRLEEAIEAAGMHENVAETRQREFTPLFASYRSPMANMLGLRYIAVHDPIEKVDKKLRPGTFPLVARTREAYIYENPDVLPRVMFVPGWRRANFLGMIKSGEWPEFDPKQTVLLEKKPPFEDDGSPAGGSVSLAKYENTVVEITVDATSAGTVVLNDVWHPWWTATVDGAPVDIVRANVLFRAVFVPAGRHTVRFEFKPFSGAFRETLARLKGEPVNGFEPEQLPLTTASAARGKPETQSLTKFVQIRR